MKLGHDADQLLKTVDEDGVEIGKAEGGARIENATGCRSGGCSRLREIGESFD